MIPSSRLVAVAIALAGPFAGAAQEQAPIQFEVASVKRSSGDTAEAFMRVEPGQVQARVIPVQVLVQQAVQVTTDLIYGLPEWTRSERYDVIAKIPASITISQFTVPAMLRALLVERFQFVMHREARDLPLYHLVRAAGGGELPSGLKRAPAECPADGRSRPDQPAVCNTQAGPGRLTTGNMPMGQLARALSGRLGRLVVDRTGLTGNFQFDLSYAPDRMPAPGVVLAPDLLATDPNAPPMLTAVQEQLGLKLEPGRGPVDVVVVDRIERPAAD